MMLAIVMLKPQKELAEAEQELNEREKRLIENSKQIEVCLSLRFVIVSEVHVQELQSKIGRVKRYYRRTYAKEFIWMLVTWVYACALLVLCLVPTFAHLLIGIAFVFFVCTGAYDYIVMRQTGAQSNLSKLVSGTRLVSTFR